MDQERSEISQLGEFGLINRINSNFKLTNTSSVTGIGDDAAILDGGRDPRSSSPGAEDARPGRQLSRRLGA